MLDKLELLEELDEVEEELDEKLEEKLDEELLELNEEGFDEEELDEEGFDEEELDEEGFDEEELDELSLAVALKEASDGVPEPFAQKPKLMEPLAAIFLFQTSGVTVLLLTLAFQRLLICEPARSKVMDQPVTWLAPLLPIST